MGTVLLVLAAVLFIAAVVVFVVALRRPKKPREGRQDPLAFATAAPQFGPRQLGPGAIVSYGGIDYVVRGSVTYREGPFVWWEHLLEGGAEPIWFSVEDDDGRLELAMWTARKDLQLEPGGQHVIEGVTYTESERGHAGYTTEGTTGLPAGGEMDFVDYASADKTALLSFERWATDMPWEVSTGKSVLTGELTVYPAPPPESE
ncbi:MAG: hypothetical protein QOC88_3382 [Mycobacterium sp.]|jgi:hypothetical protein|nr:hypothetical protein [Mycobacterium sp.]MDT5166488.1 hypothetical protein [Mycobacterium sp.]MDT5203694.1 hypothetical protein [Mycobacterium sp.]